MTWKGWSALHPHTRVVSASTGFTRPYSDGEVVASPTEDPAPYLSSIRTGTTRTWTTRSRFFRRRLNDQRRQPKERVFGIPNGAGGGKAYPFLALADEGSRVAINDVVSGRPVIVLWDGLGKAAYAYRPHANGQDLTFSVQSTPQGSSVFVDDQTGSWWGWNGVAIQGSLQGARMEPVTNAFVAFWFAWAAFHPQTELWQG